MTSGPGASAAVPSRAEGDGGPPLSERGMRLTMLVLHAAFAVVAGLALVLASVGEVDGPRPAVVTALVVWVVAYLVLAVPALHHRGLRRGTAYLVVLVGVLAVVATVEPSLLFVMFLAYPQAWFLSGDVRTGVGWSVAVAVAATAGPLVAAVRGDEPLWGPGQTVVGLVFSLTMGLWVFRVIEHSDQRAALIRDLERTRAELALVEHERGVLAERERLAGEVHDTLAQGYTSIVVLSQTAAAQVEGDPAGARERLGLIEEVARDNLREARAVVAAFAPVGLEDSTLVEALERLAERFARETGLAVRVDTAALTGAVALRRDEEVVLLRGAQEALTNVRRHASARSVVVRLSVAGEADHRLVSVHVEDDGVGFDPAAARGTGLDGLRGRVASVGGAVDVASAPGEGTRVTLRVPAVGA